VEESTGPDAGVVVDRFLSRSERRGPGRPTRERRLFSHGEKRVGRSETVEDFLRSVEAIVEAMLFLGP
jgi:hypothetical protein